MLKNLHCHFLAQLFSWNTHLDAARGLFASTNYKVLTHMWKHETAQLCLITHSFL